MTGKTGVAIIIENACNTTVSLGFKTNELVRIEEMLQAIVC
jgi:hypothetical protein